MAVNENIYGSERGWCTTLLRIYRSKWIFASANHKWPQRPQFVIITAGNLLEVGTVILLVGGHCLRPGHLTRSNIHPNPASYTRWRHNSCLTSPLLPQEMFYLTSGIPACAHCLPHLIPYLPTARLSRFARFNFGIS